MYINLIINILGWTGSVLYLLAYALVSAKKTEGDSVLSTGLLRLYLPAPVEYKRGKEKQNHSDEAQLCAQAMCLEEMLSVPIPNGYLYYGETRHRVAIELTAELRTLVKEMSDEMHNYFSRGYTPKVKPFKGCRSCSLADVCLPVLQGKVIAASKYIKQQIENGG